MTIFTHSDLIIIEDMFRSVIGEWGGLTDNEDEAYQKVLRARIEGKKEYVGELIREIEENKERVKT